MGAFRATQGSFAAPSGRPSLQDGTLSRIDPRTNSVVETIPVGSGPFVVLDHPSELWVANRADTDVWRLRPG
jgi:YVTN family beta-propeller protein